MKTLIFNGSARKNGETQSMIDALTAQLEGEYKVVNAHSCNVRACVDCRYCWEHPACSIQDGWQEIDSYLRECDNVVIASPVYFCEITGPVLSVLSRIQVYWAAKTFRHEKTAGKTKARWDDSAGRRTGHGDRTDEHLCGAAAPDECQRDF